MQTYDFFTFFRRHANLWLFIIGIIEPSLYKSCISFVDWLLMWHWNFMQTYDFLTFFRRHANLWLFYIFQTTCKPLTFLHFSDDMQTNLWLFYIFQTTCKPMTFLHFSDDMQTYDFFTFFRHANLWLFIIGIIEPSLYKSCISFVDWLLMWHWNFMQTYDFFTFFKHANLWLFYDDMQTFDFLTIFRRHANLFFTFFRRHDLWLFLHDDMQTYDFFTFFGLQTLTFWHFSDDMQTYDTFFRRHANLWLFLHFSDDMQTYDFFTFFRRHANLWLFIIGIIEPSLYKRHANLWLFYIFQTTCKPMTFLHFSDDMQTYDFLTFFRRHANLWLFYIFQTTCKPMTFLPVFKRHTKWYSASLPTTHTVFIFDNTHWPDCNVPCSHRSTDLLLLCTSVIFFPLSNTSFHWDVGKIQEDNSIISASAGKAEHWVSLDYLQASDLSLFINIELPQFITQDIVCRRLHLRLSIFYFLD